MSADFLNISILGGGLLGGSLALALEQTENPPTVKLWSRRQLVTDAARSLGIREATSNLAECVSGSDLLILAVPVGSMSGLVSQAIEAGLPAGCLITDVGSVKCTPHRDVSTVICGRHLDFIGSHPMAGSEQGGIHAASAKLFQNAACLLTNDDNVSSDKCAALEDFWRNVGCRTTWMSATAHDELVARISHLPHIIAASAANICLKKPAEGNFGGGGLRDTTRVASGNPDMWAEILTENREALIHPLRDTIEDLTRFLSLLESGDQEAARQWLAAAKHQRDFLNPQVS